MSLGILMKGFNAIHFKRPLDFLFEFVPQIIFLIALFGWMDILIIAKWLEPKYADHDYVVGSKEFNDLHYTPPIITTMIDIFLSGAGNT